MALFESEFFSYFSVDFQNVAAGEKLAVEITIGKIERENVRFFEFIVEFLRKIGRFFDNFLLFYQSERSSDS